MWSGSGDSNTLTNAPITVNGSDVSFSGDINLPDDGKAIFGTGSDLEIYHDATNSFISNSTGQINITSSIIALRNQANNETMLRVVEDGAVELFYNNDLKLVTTNTGVAVTGDISATDGLFSGALTLNNRLLLGSYVQHVGDDDTYFGFSNDNNYKVKVGGNDNILSNINAVSLAYAGNVKLATTNTGVDVSGVTKTDSILINATSPIASSIVTLNKASTSTGTDVSQFYDVTKENTTDSAASETYGVVNRVDNISNFENGSIISLNNVCRVSGTGDVENVYPCINQASITGTGTIDWVIGSFNEVLLSNASGTVNNLRGTHTAVDLVLGATAGEITLLSFDFDQSAGTTITGDFQFIKIKNEQPIASSIGGTARALNIESELPSFFAGSIGIGTNSPDAKLDIKGSVSTALTGIVSVTISTTAVVGVGTLFTTELEVGNAIKIGAEIFTVSTITDALNLTIDSAHVAGASAVTAYSDSTLFNVDNGNDVNLLTVDKSGSATFASSVSATDFIGVKASSVNEQYNSYSASDTISDTNYNVNTGVSASTTITVPTGLSTNRSWELTSFGFSFTIVAASGVTITIINNSEANNLVIQGKHSAKLVATSTANQFLLIKY